MSKADRELGALHLKALRGDTAARTELYQRYARLAFGTALKAGLTRDEAAEAVSSTFGVVLLKLDQLREPSRLPGWIRKIAHREALRVLRERPRSHLDVYVNEPMVVDHPLEAQAAREHKRLLLLMVEQRDPDLLRAWVEHDGRREEIALDLQTSRSAIDQRICRLRRALRLGA